MAHRHTASRLVKVRRARLYKRTISCSGQSLPDP
ncbi:hypothetical protein QJ490_25285, partial [Escherichia coli]